jgi:hypothetical protein
MIAPEPAVPGGSEDPRAGVPARGAGPPGSSEHPVSTLRGAGVEVDGRRAGRVALALALAALAAVAIVLFVAGADKNNQINRLRQHGVPTDMTVTTCRGLLGGSGSNAAGYACRASFTYNGRRYDVAIPGTTLLAPGATVRGVIDPDNPALVSTAGAVATEHASRRVFILPTVLVAVLVVMAGALSVRRRRRHSHPAEMPPPGGAR